MESIKVYSTIDDKDIRKSKENLQKSPIWAKAYTSLDLPRIKETYPVLYEYSIKFEGTTPIMVSKVSKL